jgi:hypothetical protein
MAYKPRGDLDPSVAFSILLHVWPGYGDSVDDGGATTRAFLFDWYDDPSTNMVEFAERWIVGRSPADPAPVRERTLTLPYSEVCMHVGVAGKVMTGRLVNPRHPMVQLLDEDGRLFSAPITTGEAGWGMTSSDHTVGDFDAEGRWYPKGTRPPCSTCGGPAPATNDDSSHDDCFAPVVAA